MSTPRLPFDDDDHLFAWSCALNLQLYDADPGPRQMTVGGPGERRTVDRRERLIDAYARDVLVHVDADLDRLDAIVAEARRKHADKAERDFPRDRIEAELVAIELAETAAQIVRDAGAADDPKARERLVVATRHQNFRDAGELFLGDPDLLATDPGDVAAELDDIDRRDD